MTDQEYLMYRIICKISDIEAPIVFKGLFISKQRVNYKAHFARKRLYSNRKTDQRY